MADRIFTSREAEETLNALRYTTKVEYSTLARLAMVYSIKKAGADVPKSSDFSGKEIRQKSVFGDDEKIFRSMIYLAHNRRFDEEDEFFSNRSICKDHIDNGLEMLRKLYQECANDENVFFKRLASEIKITRVGGAGGLIPNLDIVLGTRELNKERVIIEINNTERHANSHLAIMGKPGVGKTQLLLKILADIRIQSRYLTNYILFDYKGDVVGDNRFIEITRANTYELPHQQLPVNPFVLEDYSDQSILISAREKAESFASISTRFGPVQKGNLTESIRRGYERRSAQEQQFPDFREILAIVQEMYNQDNKKDDSLIEILRDLANFSLFWQHGSNLPLIERLTERTLIVDLHQLPVLKELAAYLVIERLYKEMSALPDSEIRDGRRALRTVLVIDEAHNYLSQKNLFLQKIIREGRSKGVVVFFASQSPNDYIQKIFDFKELLEFSIMFQCEGVSASAVQDLLGCSPRVAKDLQMELAHLRPFQVISKPLGDDSDFTKYKAEPFYKAYQ